MRTPPAALSNPRSIISVVRLSFDTQSSFGYPVRNKQVLFCVVYAISQDLIPGLCEKSARHAKFYLQPLSTDYDW